jgi:predicted methyltransferase
MKKCSMRRGIAGWPDLENNVAEWVQVQRQDCNTVIRNMIRAYAMKWAWAKP